MNKIFKVIWSKSKQCYVVVSELAKNTTGKKKIVVASILAALMAGQAMQAEAEGTFKGGGTSSSTGIAISAGTSKADASGNNAVAIGRAKAKSNGAVAIGSDTESAHNAFSAGFYSKATGDSSIAIGAGFESTGNPTKEVKASGKNGIAIGLAAQSTGESAIAFGTDATASETSATAIGKSAEASGSEATSFGVASTANKDGALAVGSHSTSSVKAGTAIGYNASVSYSGAGDSWGATAIGAQTSVTGKNAVAIGRASKASGNNSLAIGAGNNDDGTASTEFAESTGTNSLAIGYNAKAKNISAVAVGKGAKAEGVASTALGETALADQDNDSALGNSVHASGGGSSAVGYLVTTSGNQAFGAGSNTTVSGGAAIGIGYMNTASGNRAISIGADNNSTNNTASGDYSIAIGAASQATKTNSTAVGTNSNATGEDSFAGASGKASGDASIAIGKAANAGGTTAAASSIAIGDNAAASGIGSTAVGKAALADTGNDSAFGNSSHASGGGSSAIGYLVTTSGNQAFGAGSFTTVSGPAAVGIGYSNEVTGDRAVAIGSSLNGVKTGVSGNYGVAIGAASRALAESATAIGKNTTSSGADSIVIGTAATSTSAASSAISVGKNAKTEDQNAVAIGVDSYAKTMDSIAIGNTAKATGLVSTALGARAEALGTSAVAVGINAKAKKDQATALGFNAQANETNSLALGYGASATVDNGVALGSGSKANVASGVAGYNANTENIARTDKYSSLTGVALNSNLGALSVGVTDATGAATSTRQIVGVAAGTADTDAVNVAQLKSVNLAFTGNSGSGDVNLSKSKLAVEGGTNSFITTTAANKKLEINTTQGTLKNTSGTVSVNGANGLAVAQNVADVINQSNADQTIKYKANGTGNNSVKLSDGLNFTNGTTTTATVGANGQVSFDLNTAIQKSITDSAAAVARSISLGGDTGTTTAKSLSSANVNFGIKSGSPTYLTTIANGNDVTLTINEQAIKNAAKDASSFKVKANSTAAEDVKGGDTVTFNNGDNIAITQTGKTFKIATAKNVTFDTATIGTNTTIGSTGVSTNKVTVGNISIDGTDGINAGGKIITNVGTGRVSNSSTDDGNVANIGDVKAIANDAVANLSTSLGVTDGTNNGTVNLKNQSLKVVGTGVAKATVNGQTITVDVAKGTIAANATTGALTGTAGVVDANDMATAVNTAITKAVDTATGTQKLDISAGGTDSSVNLKTQKLTVAGTGAATAALNNQTITVNVAEGTFTNKTDGTTSATAGVAKATDVAAAINNANTVLGNKITAATQSLSTLGDNKFKLTADSTSTTGQALNKSGGLSFKIAGDGDLVSTSATTDTINVTVKKGTLTNAADGSLNVTDSGVVTADNMKSVVNDAITKAVTSAKDGSAWNISTNGGTATKVSGGNTVDLAGGDNIEITQNSADGKKITVKTKKNLTLDSVTAANTVKVGSGTNLITLDGSTGAVSGNTFTAGSASMNTTGFRLTGGPSVTTTGIDAGNKVITNVASGGTTSTNAANIGDVNDKVTSAINDLTTNLTKSTSISYTANNDTPVKTVSLKDGFKFTDGTLTTAEVAANGVVKFNVTQGSLSTDGNGNITNTAGVATTDDVKTAVNTAITKAVDNATSTQKLDISAGGTDSSINLKTQKLTVAGTGAAKATVNGQTITVDVAKGTIAANSTTGALTGTAGVVDANDMATAVNTAITKAVDNATGTQALNLTDGTNTGSVKLSTQTLSVSGTNGVQATVGGQGITIGLDTATKNLISNSSTAVDTLGKNTFTLKADSTDTTAQALNKSGGLAFKVAGDGDLVSTSATTDAVKVTVKKGTLSTNADGTINKATDGVVTTDNMTTVVNDAITKAVTSAKDGSAWNISTNGGTATKVSGGNTVDLINGDNIEITQDGTDGKKITVKTKKDLTLDSVTAANTVKVGSGTNLITLDGTSGAVSANTFTGTTFTAGATSMNATGFRLTGGPSVTTTGIDAGSAAITNVASGGTTGTNAANIADVKQIAKDTVTNAVNNLSSTLTVTDGITDGNVSLKTDKLKIVGTGAAKATVNGQTITVDVAKGTIAANSTTGALTGTAGVVDANDMAAAVNTAITKAVDNATGTQALNLTDGTNTGSVKLSTQTLSVSGTNGVQATVGGQGITIGLDTATKNLISNSSTAVDTLGKNTFTLKADSTDTTAQALNKSGGLAFKVAGDGDLVSTSATTDAVNVTVKKGTLSTNTDGTINKTADGVVTADNMKTVVNDAITKAVTSAKDGSAWNISTNGGTATKVSGGNTVDLINGDNIEITQDGTDGKKITVKTKKDLTLDSVTAANTVKVGSGTNLITLDGTSGAVSANTFTGNTFTAGNASMNTTGFHLTGGPSVTTTGIDAGNKVITNVASGGTTSTNAANIGDINAAISSLTTNLGKNTTIAYKANSIGGQTVSLADGFNFTNGTLTTAEVAANGIVKFNVTQGSLSTDGNGNITNTTGVATTDDVKNAVNTAITKAVDNATGTQKLDISAGGTDSSVNLKTQKLTVAGTGAATASLNGQTITVDVAKGTLAANSTTGALTGTAGVVDANDMATAVNTAITKAVDNATGTQALNLTDGTNTGSVKLSTQTLSVSGTNGVEATVGGQGITIGLDTATKNLISNSSTAVDTLGKNTFTLKADSTDTTAQALNKSGGLAFKVAGDGDLVSTSATTDTVKVTVKKGELSNAADGSLNVTDSGVVTADNMKTVVNDAITKAVTSAKDGSAWNISTNGGTATKVSGGNTVDLINGDNIEITQDGTDGKKITVKTKKDLTVDSVTAANTVKVGSATNLITLDGTTGAVSGNTFTAGNASMSTTGFRLTGGPSMTTTGIDAGNKVITNVASGGTTSTNAANIGDITKAISDLTTNLTKNTSISYTANTATPGQTVSLKDGFNFTNGTLTTAEVAAGGVVKFNVTQGSLSTDANGNITNTAGVATTDDVKNAVNTAINKAVTNSSAAVNTLGANTFTLTGDNSTSTTGQALNKNGGLSFKVAGDGNFITTSAATDTVTVSIKQGTFGSNTDGTAKSTTNGVATTNDVANIVNTTVTNAVTKATGAQVLNITDGNNNGSINLKNDALKVVGTDGVTTEVNGKTITVGLDTATKDKINNASAATNKNISLAADTGNASSQSLKDGDVSFAVKGATGDYISTNMNGNTVEISTKRATINSNATTGQASVTGNDGLATAKNVADAINAATAKAVSQSAWKLAADGTTGTETISGGDTVNFKAGSNMEVSRTGKDITYKTKDNVAFTTVTAGTGANEVKLDGNTGTVTAKDITATGDVNAKNVTTSGNVTAAGTVKGDTVQGNTVKAGNVTITGGTTNTITGLSNTTWTPAGGIQADRAATEGQLQQAINQVNATVGSTALTFKGDTNPAQSMTLQGNTFAITGDTMIKTTTNTNGIGLSLDTSKVNIAYAANGLNGQTTSIASGLNFTDGDHTKATVAASGVVKYDAKTSTISVANGHAAASGNDLATADNVADAINQMTQNNAGNTTQLRQEISKVATETQRVGAHAAAMAALKPIQYDPLAPTQIMAGVGNYRGESAAALGVAHYTNDNTMFNVGVSVGGNHNMINAGVTHKFGISAEKKNIPDRYKAGPISSIYVMQDEMTQLRSENEAYKAKLDKQQSEIDALKAAVDQLLASKA
ncbi:YadA-like family protein [Veillonella atypica]|uniref:ESPR-type extended signal peptide-containing protein n=1 Tax=Veillonella atypica TaxID=39777 RepID=A0AAJ1QB48_9FIRM|nr:YadA-like family protein [Veillonella atypica]MDK7357775.1 ESPR-type extended signal peptide-containing protein [Veillonella atypica]